MALLPESIVDRLIEMERRLNALSTAVNTRPPLTEILNGSLALRRQETENGPVSLVAQLTTSGPGGTKPVLRFNDAYGHEVLSDDIVTGGIARPWLPLLPPQDIVNTSNWASTTATAAWTTVATSTNQIWQPKMRLRMLTRVTGTGIVRVMVNGAVFGAAEHPAGTTFDHTNLVTTAMATDFGKDLTVEIQARVTSASGTVSVQPVLMHGRQT
ncbi:MULTISPECIES: hypothetical protein [unclassified Streptomyces]|uniref:hypothetical protein n=1 Tax=unclassified Streptomyces TaxID=2593676 RepID=UPI0036FEFC3D